LRKYLPTFTTFYYKRYNSGIVKQKRCGGQGMEGWGASMPYASLPPSQHLHILTHFGALNSLLLGFMKVS
jgi:hypothetical protein